MKFAWFVRAWLVLMPCLAQAIPITTADFFGSSTRWRVNDCSLVAPDADCSLISSPGVIPIPRVDRGFVREVGAPMTVVEAGTSIFAETTFTGLFDTPVVRGSVFSGPQSHGLADVRAFQTYAYDGTVPVNIEFGGILDFSYSGISPVSALLNSRPGDGFIGLSVRAFDLAGAEYGLFDVGGDNTRLFVSKRPFSNLGEAAYNSFFDPVPAPGVDFSVPVFSNLTVQPGQELLFEVRFQASGDRGGFTNAANTFNFGFRNAPDVFFDNLTSGTQALKVPEPGTFGLLAIGLLGIGLARRRKNG